MIRDILSKRIWKKVGLTIALLGIIHTMSITSTYAQSSLTTSGSLTDSNNTSKKVFIQGKGYQTGKYDLGAAAPTPFNWIRQTQINVGDNPEFKWAADIGGEGVSSPVTASDGTVYARNWGDSIDGLTQAYLKAINEDGSTKWSIPVGPDGGSSPVITSDGTIIIGSGLYGQSNGVYAFNPDGTQKFYYPTDGGIVTTPTIGSDGTIYVLDQRGTLYAISSDGIGRQIFTSYSKFASSYSPTPAIGRDGTIYFFANNETLYAMDSYGKTKWIYSVFTGSVSTPTIGDDGTIYVGAGGSNGRLYAFSPDGTIKWTFRSNSGISSSPVISPDGTIYIGDETTTYALNSDGSVKWSIPVRMNSAPIIAADGTLYVNSIYLLSSSTNRWQSKIEAISPKGKKKWSTSISTKVGIQVPLSIGNNGTLYAFATDGKLYAYQSEKPVINGAVDKIIEFGESFDRMNGITASDNLDGEITSKIIVTGKVNNKKLGSYLLTYKVTDTSGNTTTTTRKITVVDTAKPVISGATNKTIPINSTFDLKFGVTAKDNVDGDLTSVIKVTGTVNTKKKGIYTLKYTVADKSGNIAVATRKITVIDNVKPVISGATSKAIKLNSKFDPKDAVTATDNVDGDLTNMIKVTGTVNTKKKGIYTLTYTVTDRSGNKAVVTRKITVK